MARLLEIFSHLAIRVFEWTREGMKSFEGVDLREYENVGPLVGYVYTCTRFSSYSMQQWRSIAKKLKKISNFGSEWEKIGNNNVLSFF